MPSTKSIIALVPTGFGINCEAESTYALTSAGAQVSAPHLNDLLRRPELLARAQLLLLAGGFSFGDHLGSGVVLARRMQKLGAALNSFIADGGLVLGICNGFQTMVRWGLLPRGTPGEQQVSLIRNAHGTFYDGWITLRSDPKSPCVFTRGLDTIDLPVRHGEGRLVIPEAQNQNITTNHLAPLVYIDPASGASTMSFPHNPNGSVAAIAALCDRTGRIFGLMPHPEAFLYPENHPQWRRRPNATPHGRTIFENAIAACRGQESRA